MQCFFSDDHFRYWSSNQKCIIFTSYLLSLVVCASLSHTLICIEAHHITWFHHKFCCLYTLTFSGLQLWRPFRSSLQQSILSAVGMCRKSWCPSGHHCPEVSYFSHFVSIFLSHLLLLLSCPFAFLPLSSFIFSTASFAQFCLFANLICSCNTLSSR